MSIKFEIRHTAAKAEREGDQIVRFTGTGEPFNRISEREAKKVGVDGGGNPRLKFVTGLDTGRVSFLPWYTEDERKEVLKQIEELKPIITEYYGGKDVVDDSNIYFWKDDRTVNKLHLTHSNIDLHYDIKNPTHALLYLSIVSGAFEDLVAPTKEWAERHQRAHFLHLETDGEVDDDDDTITRSDAHAALAELRKDHSSDALFILAWCLQYDTNAYGAYLKSTPTKDMINYHIKYIDGKLQMKKKKNAPKLFLEYFNKWKGTQTRPLLYTEAYVKAGEYYNFLQQRNKKFTTTDDTILGSTVNEAVETLMKPKFSKDLETLRDKVEAKWKE